MKTRHADSILAGISSSAPIGPVLLFLVALFSCGLCSGCKWGGSSADHDLDRYKQAGRRIEAAVNSIDRVLSEPHAAPATDGLTARHKPPAPPRQDVQAEAEQEITFRLTGIAGTRSNPLVLTTAGTAGLGEEVAGFRVVEIGDNTVIFADKRGRKVNVNLYKDHP